MVLAILVSMVVSPDKTVNSYLNSPTGEGSSLGKDVFYRLKNSPFICWRMLMWHLVYRFLKVTSEDSDVDDTSSRYLIFDDTTLSKTGKRIEKIGKVWDHVTNSDVLGFKLLVMMYWDGKSSIPLNFSLHREKGKKDERPFSMTRKELKRQYSFKRIKDSYTAKRVEELDTNKIQMVMRMFFTAIYRGLRVDYVLVDSWFICDALIQAIRSVKNKEVHLIGMYKFAKTKFGYQGKSLTHAQINNILGKPRRCRSLGHQYKQAKVMYQGVEIYLFFSRRGKGDNWKVLLTLRFRYDNYESKGALYRSMNADVLRETLDRRLWGLFIELVCAVSEILEIDADELFERMLTNPKAETMIMALCCSVMGKDD
jgi:hypothetical protein